MKSERNINENKIREAFQFADTLNANYIIFHPGINGLIDETIKQLRPFVDSRCLIENKPFKGSGTNIGIGSTQQELAFILNELRIGFCLDFGHAICAANSFKKEPMVYIHELLQLHPAMFHLTDGDYQGEHYIHLHYGKGTFPIKKILDIIPNNSRLTNEAKHDSDFYLDDFKKDVLFLRLKI